MDPRHNSSQRNQEPGTLTSGRQVVDIGLNYSTISSFGGNGNIMSSSPLKEQSPEDSLSQVNKTFNMDRTAMDIPSSFYYNSPITEGYQTFSNKSPVSSKSSSGLFCRICHDGDSDDNRLISPCSCSGSVGLIHRACIEKWLTTVNQDTCEICQQKFMVSKHSKPFTKWLLTPAVGDDQRNLLGDSVCFLLLTPLTTISAYLCASGAMFYLRVNHL